jgi:hypothetical protein
MTRIVKIEARLTSLDDITDAELETIAQQAIDDTNLDIIDCRITLQDDDS